MFKSTHIVTGLLLVFTAICLQGCYQTVIESGSREKVKIWMEAESGQIEDPMEVHSKEDASAGQFIEVEPGNNSIETAPGDGFITYRFKIRDSGRYKIWGRVIVCMDDEDAFWVKMDEGEWVKWKDIQVGCDWHWDEIHDNDNNNRVMIYDLEKGIHTLKITYGMDQTRLDKIVLTNDLKFVPEQTGPGITARYNFNPPTPILNEEVIFDASASSSSEGSIKSYKWDLGDGNVSTGPRSLHKYDSAGVYTVCLTTEDNAGLTGIVEKELTVYADKPVADFVFSPDRAHSDENIAFNAASSFDPNGNIVSYSWDFGDGNNGDDEHPVHSYRNVGEYTVKLTVTDNEGHEAVNLQLVTIIPDNPKKVIFETDMCLDVDDVGALAMLHAMANQGEAEILAVCYNEVHPDAAAAIDAINTWYGRGDIPIGVYKKPLAQPDASAYLKSLSQFPNDINNSSIPDAVSVYRAVLSKQPDNSVTIISVKKINNLSDLLIESPDLVAKKVKEIVIMGGINNDGFNLSRHEFVSAAENVLANWPSPLAISQPGYQILTGKNLINSSDNNPVRTAYYSFFYSNFCNRPSWDQIAVLYGVRGCSDYFLNASDGKGRLINGYTWEMKEGYRTYIKTIYPAETYAKTIEKLMLATPLDKPALSK